MTLPFAPRRFQLAFLVVILGAFNAATAFVDESPFPPGYTHYPDLRVAYKVHTEHRTWAGAKQACEAEDARLAIIDTMTKVGHVAVLKPAWSYVWIGISRPNSGSSWVSAGNHMVMPSLPWAPGKPQGSHNCLAVRGCNRGLTNEDCSSSKGFVCEVRELDDGDEIAPN